MTWGLLLQRIPVVVAPRARLRSAEEITIARKRAADTALLRMSGPDAEPGDLSADVPELRRLLLAWWDNHGRHTIPWKLRPDGSRPADGEAIDPHGVFVAEVMRAARQHSRRASVPACTGEGGHAVALRWLGFWLALVACGGAGWLCAPGHLGDPEG